MLLGGVQQITNFFLTSPNITGALFAIVIGDNDYYFNNSADPNRVVANVMDIMNIIHQNGGTDFFIGRIPLLGSLPYYAGSPLAQQLNQLCTTHNNLLTVCVCRNLLVLSLGWWADDTLIQIVPGHCVSGRPF